MSRLGERTAWWLAAAGIALGLALQLRLVFLVNINWDEFFYLGGVHAFLRGELSSPLQSFHVRLFGWLAALPGDEIFQIVAGRIAAFSAEILAFVGIYSIARRFVTPLAALFSLLTLLSTAYVLQHGFAFRTDPFVVAVGIGSIALAFAEHRAPRAAAAAAGALFAVALLFSLKSVFFAVPLGAALLGAKSMRQERLIVFGAALALTFGSLYLWHGAGLTDVAVPAAGAPYLSSIAKTQFLPRTLPGWQFLPVSLRQNPLTWICLLGGVATLLPGLRRERRRNLLLLALAFPLTTFLYYRNTFPYYYLFALAPAAVLVGVFIEWLARAASAALRPRGALVVTAALWAGVSTTLLAHATRMARDEVSPQRELVGVVHQLFPDPVPYIDRCSMLASFPKVGFFMTGWGMENYYQRGTPLLRDALLERAPPLLLANSPGLWVHLPEERARRMPYALLQEDRQALRENFVHHWGWIWVAGKELALPKGSRDIEFELLIAGRYTLEADGNVTLDGVERRPGEVLTLVRGRHQAASASGATALRLRWGDHLPRPAGPPSTLPLFTGF